MKVYIVFDSDDLEVSQVYDSEAKALAFIEQWFRDKHLIDTLDVQMKEMLPDGQFTQEFYLVADPQFILYCYNVL